MRVLGLIALALLSGCASQQTTPESSTKPSAAAAAPAAQAAPANEAAPARVAMNEGEEKEEKEFVPPPGYKERLEGGKRYYCAKVVVLGTRFPKDDCRTQAELEEMEVQKAAMRGAMGQRSSVCTSTGGCANP